MATLTVEQTLENFIASTRFAWAVIKSTKAGFGGSSYKVELLPDGTHRVLWASEIGNQYDSPGTIANIPTLSDEDYQDIEVAAGSDEVDAMAKELAGTETLDEIAQYMKESLS